MSIREAIKRRPLGNRDVNLVYSKDTQQKPAGQPKPTVRQIQATQNNDSATIHRDRDAEVRYWQKYLREAVVYIDQTYPNAGSMAYKTHMMMDMFRRAGSKITPFFSKDVDIIVSRKKFDKTTIYPQSDIFSKVDGRVTRVWHFNKVMNVLKYIGVDLPTMATEAQSPSRHPDLLTLLSKEKLQKHLALDLPTKPENLKYFAHPFIYVYDLQKKYAPIAVKEWEQENSWPGFHETTRGKSLFANIQETNSEKLQKKAKLLRKFERGQEERDKLKRFCVIDSKFDIEDEDNTIYACVERAATTSELIRDATNSLSILSSPVKISSSAETDKLNENDTAAAEMNDQFAQLSHPNTPVSFNLHTNRLVHNTQAPQIASDLRASGMASIDSMNTQNLSTNVSALLNNDGTLNLNPFLNNNKNMKRRIVDAPREDLLKRAKLSSAAKKTQPQQPKTKNKGITKNLNKCENCRQYFSNFSKHIQSAAHREYAANNKNFVKIDRFIKALTEDGDGYPSLS